MLNADARTCGTTSKEGPHIRTHIPQTRARAQRVREEEHHENMKRTACISAHIYSCQGQRVDKRFSQPLPRSPSSPTIFPAIISPSRVFINYSDNVWNFTSWPGDVLIRNNSERIVMKIAHVHRVVPDLSYSSM